MYVNSNCRFRLCYLNIAMLLVPHHEVMAVELISEKVEMLKSHLPIKDEYNE